MARKRFQRGSVYLCGKTPMWYGRYREDIIGDDGERKRIRRNVLLGSKKRIPYPAARRTRPGPAALPNQRSRLSSFTRGDRCRVRGEVEGTSAFPAQTIHEESRRVAPRGVHNSSARNRLDDLGVENQQMFVGHLSEKVSRKTVVNVVGTLSSMLNTAKNWGYVCEGVSVNRLVLPGREVKQQARTFTPEQAGAILELAQDPWRVMFAIAACWFAGGRDTWAFR